jgi:hypothetical protein
MATRMQEALSHNARNQAIRKSVGQAEADLKSNEYRAESVQKRVDDLSRQLAQARLELTGARDLVEQSKAAVESAKLSIGALQDQDTADIQRELEQIDAINARIRANESKRNAEAEAAEMQQQYRDMTDALEQVRMKRMQLLAGVQMPLDGLSVDDDGQLIYRGNPWDCMSGSEQLRVAAAICAAVNPRCGFVLLDKLEAMDTESLAEFAAWLADRDLQAIGTRVSRGDECSIVIEDGSVVEKEEYTF